jgi:hypothetical protein
MEMSLLHRAGIHTGTVRLQHNKKAEEQHNTLSLAAMVAQDNQNAPVSDAEAAEAAAEVAAMTGVNPARQRGRAFGGGARQQRDPTADQAVMGAAQEGSFEILDETGERVRARFLQFLME